MPSENERILNAHAIDPGGSFTFEVPFGRSGRASQSRSSSHAFRGDHPLVIAIT
jgi:hypothetical protein